MLSPSQLMAIAAPLCPSPILVEMFDGRVNVPIPRLASRVSHLRGEAPHDSRSDTLCFYLTPLHLLHLRSERLFTGNLESGRLKPARAANSLDLYPSPTTTASIAACLGQISADHVVKTSTASICASLRSSVNALHCALKPGH